MFCPDKNVIFRRFNFRFVKNMKFHMFSYINHCFHDVQHHLIIIIDGAKVESQIFLLIRSKILISQIGLRLDLRFGLKRRAWLSLCELDILKLWLGDKEGS